ncbi:MAG: acyl--CoA ligase [Eubacterium sp.]|nr:acyl--CoA ligase [Eubacterium sp.]
MVKSIVEAVFQGAERHPDKLCLADDNNSVTYCEYKNKIERFAACLQDKGVKSGDAVVIEACQTVEYLALQLAVQLLGAVFVPMEHNSAAEKIEALADTVSAALVITNKKCGEDITSFAEEAEGCEPLTDYTLPLGDEVCEILFSTGTTGKEKGIVLTNRNNIALAENVMYGVEMEEDNVELIPSPLNHSHGLRRYYANMVIGASVVILASILNLLKFFSMIEEYNVNSIDLVPTALAFILKRSKDKFSEYKDQLRYIQFGAAPLMEADKERICELLPNTRLYNFYGSTESGCIVIYNFNTENSKENCIGKPTKNAEILIVDDDRKPISSDENNTGLLACRGAMNMSGYYHDEEETNAVLVDGVVYTNDIAYFDEDGDIILLGRQGSVINVGGKKVSPDEIENAAKQIKGVIDCGCIPVPDSMLGSIPKLFVETRNEESFDAVMIHNELAKMLEPFKVPKQIVYIEKIPRPFNGKLIRRELK